MEVKKSAFQTPITIKETIESLHRKEYLLPSIQREVVWNQEQMIRLFDSLMRGYTIGSFLFWNVNKDKVGNFQFYEFLREYHERDCTHNPKANVTGEDNITAILDGQQRLTALYIGLKGSFAYKMPRMRWENDEAFPKRKLYLNLLSLSNEFDLLYNFAFLTNREALTRNDSTYWFEVGKIIEFDSLNDIINYLRDNNLILVRFPQECLSKLFEVIVINPVINYYLETSHEIEGHDT